jgi:predicted nuclease of restriction endonuclease-like (RecB) superfamily
MIGMYLFEYEQNGMDRATYGAKILASVSESLTQKGLKGLSVRNLKLFRQVYRAYPLIGQTISAQFPLVKIPQIGQTESAELAHAERLVQHCGFSHFVELCREQNLEKRRWYEVHACEGHWDVADLRRQINTQSYDRTVHGKAKPLIATETSQALFRDPYLLEFSRIAEKGDYDETDLEKALLDHLQEFLLELGNGFCFEGRQKRISLDGDHDRIDMVLYHRILKCHVLIELKAREFRHSDVGQMNYYLNYYKNEVMQPGDNPPIGLILCTDKNNMKVEYATAGMESQLLVSKYELVLPKREELERVIQEVLP